MLRDNSRTLLTQTDENSKLVSFTLGLEGLLTTSPFPCDVKGTQLSSPNSPVTNELSTISSPIDSSNNPHKKRQRKNRNQLQILKKEFNSREMWSKDKINLIATCTGLLPAQIYK